MSRLKHFEGTEEEGWKEKLSALLHVTWAGLCLVSLVCSILCALIG